jgi:predicted GNAT family acetyltransferase
MENQNYDGVVFVLYHQKHYMKFENNKSENGGVITLNNEIKEVGRLTYTIFPEDNRLVISFVLVHREFEGRGMGKFLVEEAIRFARENNWKVYPHCSYARAVMRRMNDVEDVFLQR